MKIRHMENARLVLFATYIAAKVFVGNDDTLFKEVNEFLISNGISMEDITWLKLDSPISSIFNSSKFNSFRVIS